MKSASTNSRVPFFKKVDYLGRLLGMRIAGWLHPQAEIGPWSDFEFYEELFNRFSGASPRKLNDLRILEIGYGQRPWRLISLLAMGTDAWGIDLEHPMFGFSMRRLLQTWRQNGVERALKSAVRSLLFDFADLRKLKLEAERRGWKFDFDRRRFLVGNATEKVSDLEGRPFDLIISEDVFEHIPALEIDAILVELAKRVDFHGILLLRPHLYTGIAGGHDLDFYPHSVETMKAPAQRAWAHLWDPAFQVNTFLSKLRLDDYRRLFGLHFEILAEIPKNHGFGSAYLTAELRRKIPAEISDEELLLNQVMFVLRRRPCE